MKNYSRKRCWGYTLVEILMVISILTLLSAVVLAVYYNSQEKVRNIKCRSNLHQIGMALQMYVSDNDGAWLSDTSWRRGVISHLKSGNKYLCCPDASTAPAAVSDEGIDGYAYNPALTGKLNRDGSITPVTDPSVLYSSVTVSVCDEAYGVAVTFGPNPYKYDPNRHPVAQENGWQRHSGGANYLFCDGHITWYLPDAVGYNTDLKGGNNGSSPTLALTPAK